MEISNNSGFSSQQGGVASLVLTVRTLFGERHGLANLSGAETLEIVLLVLGERHGAELVPCQRCDGKGRFGLRKARSQDAKCGKIVYTRNN